MKLICAPMATLSHEAFRRITESFGGCHEYFTEMINATSLLHNGPWEKYYLINETAPEKIVWQLTGSEAEKVAAAVPLVCEHGGIGVDLNMGCSAPQIYRTGAGIAWMIKDISQTRNLVKLVKKELEKAESLYGRHFRFSVKCRLGDEDYTKEKYFDFIQMLYDEGVELLTLHPRTKKEKLARFLPKYEMAEETACRFKNLQVYVNGNIKDLPSALYAAKLCPSVKGMMIARQAAVSPWIFSLLDSKLNSNPLKVDKVDRMQTALDFTDYVEKYQPEEFYRTRIQRFFAYYCSQFFFGHAFSAEVLNYTGIEDTKKKIEGYFERNPHERFLELN
ncbi:tRNA-dihydrouridine synthase family protein [Treponema sp.]|uniref:tRNA-dihydrouridine synthase family protein n=1 Tax=Treponema sp. TaxID=166 RepID=UPI0025CF0867|nr:tRNA-dihydrouridine synthase family protein [Treponema sp.]MCR5218175.1 tRNA-dihydrouridine synthase family protein [Treponema sp.]